MDTRKYKYCWHSWKVRNVVNGTRYKGYLQYKCLKCNKAKYVIPGYEKEVKIGEVVDVRNN